MASSNVVPNIEAADLGSEGRMGDVVATATADAVIVSSTDVTAVPIATTNPALSSTASAGFVTYSGNSSAMAIAESSAASATELVTAIPSITVHEGTSPRNITTVAAQMVAEDIESQPGVPESRAEFLSATLHKSTADAKLGITIAPDANGDIRITGLSERGSVQHSPLRVGDKLISINGKNCSDMDNGVAGELLRSVAGTITIIVHNEGGSPHMVETMVEKATPTTSVGIGVHQTYRGTLNVSKVTASGLFAHSLLNVGDRVIAVNQVNCRRMDAGTVIQMIRNAPKYVTLLTETQSTAGVVLASAEEQRVATWLNEDARLQQHHFCYCIWMIIVSLLVIGAIILRPFA